MRKVLRNGKLSGDEGFFHGIVSHPLHPGDNCPFRGGFVCERGFFMNVKRLSRDAILAAMCAVLGALSLDFGSIKLTLESIPVLIGALMFGPVDGMAIGFVGTLVYQLLRYGVSVTTLLWILPYVIAGLIVGAFAKKNDFRLSTKQTILVVVIAEIVITALNTGVLYVDSKIYGYDAAVLVMIIPRFAICIIKAIIEGSLIPLLLKALDKNTPKTGATERNAAAAIAESLQPESPDSDETPPPEDLSEKI